MNERDAIARERDLLERLLDLGQEADIAAFLRETLAVAVERTGALRGYLALVQNGDEPRWSASYECSSEQILEIEASVSSGIVGTALARGEVMCITNAMLDPAWSARVSVQRHHVEAVICAPIGAAPPIGVLYLQGRPGGGRFPEECAARVERLCRWIEPLAQRHIESLTTDHTADLRARLQVADLAGRSEAMLRLLEQVALAARFEVDTLLVGPTGSGKTAVARAIARSSARADKPFVEVNCAALSAGLVEAELFGAAPGSYTGAPRDGMQGLIPAADGGVLFLDEIAQLTPASQAALLQFLDDEKRYRRVGDPTLRRADVRVIAATHANLTAPGHFRADLYHRLNTLTVRVPGLAEREADIPLIAERVLAERAARHNIGPRPLSRAAVRALMAQEWPGHVRELAKVLEVGLMRADVAHAPTVEVEHLFPDRPAEDRPPTWAEANRTFQRGFLAEVLGELSWNVAAVAARLDLAKSHVYALIQTLGLTRPK